MLVYTSVQDFKFLHHTERLLYVRIHQRVTQQQKCAVFKDGMSSLSISGWPIAPLLEDHVKEQQNGQEVPVSTINCSTRYVLNTTNNGSFEPLRVKGNKKIHAKNKTIKQRIHLSSWNIKTGFTLTQHIIPIRSMPPQFRDAPANL